MPFRATAAGSSRDGGSFVLYVEGARDRDIMRAWAYRLLPGVGRGLFRDAVILGGRQPARAVEHFRRLRRREAGARGLCVLDRDDGRDAALPPETGLEFFTWGRRHIESYLLVPAAIRRALRLPPDDVRLDRLLADQLPPDGEEALYREVDAKRLLAPNGALSLTLDRRVPLGLVARSTREDELHPDVHALFERLRCVAGLARADARVG